MSDSSAKAGRQRRATETISLRIDSRLKLVLSQEAKKRRINLNALASQIFTTYADWGRYAEELGLIPLNNAILRELFEAIDKDTIVTIAKRTGEIVGPEEIIFLFREVNSKTTRNYIELFGGHFSRFHHWEEGGKHHYTLQHDLGNNYSLFVKHFLESMLRSTVGKTIYFSGISTSTLTFSIED